MDATRKCDRACRRRWPRSQDTRRVAARAAIAATTGMDYLLTWNCKHIANAVIIPRVNRVIRSFGFEPPLIYTPQELMEG